MLRILRTGGAGLLLFLAVAAAAPAATVTVRVEGGTDTLVPATAVQPSSTVVVDKTSSGGTTCDGASGGGALELATGGDWGGQAFSFGQTIETVKGERHVFGSGRFWSVYVNNSPSAVGICEYRPAEGDELLVFAACDGATAACFSGDPLDVTGPSTAAPGAPVTVTVDEFTSPFGQAPARARSAGATVSGGGVSATTGPDGTATLTLSERGPVTLTATKDGRVRDELAVCVTDGADGFCGTARPGATSPPPPSCETSGDDGRCGTRDRRPPRATIAGILDGQRFRPGRAPRELRATVAEDPSGLRVVKIGLSRRHRGRCWVLSGRTDRFRPARCGRHPVFVVGDRPEVSYLLPRRLPRGRYRFEVVAVDKAFNRDPRERGRNRLAFTVR